MNKEQVDRTPLPDDPKSGQEILDENFENRYEKIASDSKSIKNDSEITFLIARLQAEGLQTLIDEYGADAVSKTIQSINMTHDVLSNIRDILYASSNKTTFSILEVIKNLEPSYEKRKILFKKIKIDAEQQGKKFDEWGDAHPENDTKYDYFNDVWGGGKNFSLAAELKTNEMETLDGVFGGIMCKKHLRNLGSRVNEFASRISWNEFNKQLAEKGKDIFRLCESRDKNSRTQMKKQRAQADELCEELTKKIRLVSNEIKIEFEKWRAEVISDLNKVKKVDHSSKEVNSALEKALNEVEQKINKRTEETEKEIAEKIAPFQKLISDIENLRNYY